MVTYVQPAVDVLRLVHIGIGLLKAPNLFTYPFTFNMFNILNNVVVSHGASDCADRIVANVKDATAIVYYTNGSVYLYTGVSRRALINLIVNDNISLGRWINDVLLYNQSKCARFGTWDQVYAA